MKIIERLDLGEKMVDVAYSYDLNRSTSDIILKNKDCRSKNSLTIFFVCGFFLCFTMRICVKI